jgi:putative copper export protein
MMYKLLVVLHLLGSAVWVGGNLILVRAVLPRALSASDPRPVVEYERMFGPLGLVALLVQVFTGLLLARHWVPSLSTYFSEPTLQSRCIILKLALLTAGLVLGGLMHRKLPTLAAPSLRRFAALAWGSALIGVLLVLVGAAVRLNGLG